MTRAQRQKLKKVLDASKKEVLSPTSSTNSAFDPANDVQSKNSADCNTDSEFEVVKRKKAKKRVLESDTSDEAAEEDQTINNTVDPPLQVPNEKNGDTTTGQQKVPVPVPGSLKSQLKKDIGNRESIIHAMRNIYHVIHNNKETGNKVSADQKTPSKEDDVNKESRTSKKTTAVSKKDSSNKNEKKNNLNKTKTVANTSSPTTSKTTPKNTPPQKSSTVPKTSGAPKTSTSTSKSLAVPKTSTATAQIKSPKRGRPRKVVTPDVDSDTTGKPSAPKINKTQKKAAENTTNTTVASKNITDKPKNTESLNKHSLINNKQNDKQTIASKKSDTTKPSGDDSTTKDTVSSVFSEIRILQPSCCKQKDDIITDKDTSSDLLTIPSKQTTTAVDFVKEPSKPNKQLDKVSKVKKTAESSSTNDKGRKLSLKEYQAKKHSKRNSSSTDDGLFLEFTKVPSVSELSTGKSAAPIKATKSVDNVTILPSQSSKSSTQRKASMDAERLPQDQLATNPDVLGNILQSFDQTTDSSAEPRRSSTSQNDLNAPLDEVFV